MSVLLTSFGMLLCGVVPLAVAGEPYEAWFAETVDQALPSSLGSRLSAEELTALVGGEPTLPFSDLAVGVRLADGTLWVGSSRGLMQLVPQGKRWRLFHSRRWLPDDRVLDIAVADDGAVLVKTPAGVGRLARRTTTLAKKMQGIGGDLRLRHVREGLIGDIWDL
jgi:ligand-binding sensor domain-containing protein